MKRTLAFLLALSLLLALCACAPTPPVPDTVVPGTMAPEEPATAEFTDSLGRTVTLPARIERVAVSGPLAQIALFALCPDKLVGLASAWDESAKEYLAVEYYNLPELGQLYGGKGELNLETLLASGAQVVIDVGEAKGSAAEDLDDLAEQTGVPFVHITANLAQMGETYRALGRLLGMEAEAEALAAYCDETYGRTVALSQTVGKASVLYLTGTQGQNAIAAGSYHAEVIDLLADNAAVVEEPSSKGTGNEVDMEQLLLWDPDVILFSPGSVYASVGEDDAWRHMKAIQNGTYYEVPFGPYNWMGFPPSVQRYLGMLWMAKLLYPEAAQYDLYEAVAQYFRLFYHCELKQEQYRALVANSIGAN